MENEGSGRAFRDFARSSPSYFFFFFSLLGLLAIPCTGSRGDSFNLKRVLLFQQQLTTKKRIVTITVKEMSLLKW